MLLCGKNLSFYYNKNNILFSNFSIEIEQTEKVALFAPSGYGKSTLAKILAGYEKPITGTVTLNGSALQSNTYCPVQLIHQHPEKSVNPKWTIRKILSESCDFDMNILKKIGNPKEYLDRYPFELSGGELQRICIARAINDKTKFIIADEITTMLDSITQAKIWNFLLEEIDKRKIGLLVITHNEFLAKKICTRTIDFNN